MSDSSNLIDLASETVEEQKTILPLVPSPNISLLIDKNNPFDIVAEEVDIKKAKALDPFEICFDDAFKKNISSKSQEKEEKEISYDELNETFNISPYLLDENEFKISNSLKSQRNLLELDNLQASLLNLHEMDSFKLNDNFISQDEISLLNKLQINENQDFQKSYENSLLSEKIDFLNTSVDDLKEIVAKRIDKCIKTALNESKTNFNCSLNDKKEKNEKSDSSPKRLNRANSESSFLNKLNNSVRDQTLDKDSSDLSHHFTSKKALSDLTRDLISLKRIRRSSVTNSYSHSFTLPKEIPKNSIFDSPVSSQFERNICDEEEPDNLLTNSFDAHRNENFVKLDKKTVQEVQNIKTYQSDESNFNHQNKIELKTKIGENDVVIIVTPSCKSKNNDPRNLQDSLVPQVEETLNSLFGSKIKPEDNSKHSVTTKCILNTEQNVKTYETSSNSRRQNPLVRLKKNINIANSHSRGPLKATMPVQQMAKDFKSRANPEVQKNNNNTHTPEKKDGFSNPKATSTPINHSASSRINQTNLNKKSYIKTSTTSVEKMNRSLTEPPVSPSVPILRRSNSMTSPHKKSFSSKKEKTPNQNKKESPTISKNSKTSATSPLKVRHNAVNNQSKESSKPIIKKSFRKPLLKLKSNKENKCN